MMGIKKENVQRDFLKFTGQQIKNDLQKNHPKVLEHLKVGGKDRKYQFWERNSLSIDLYSEAVFMQKLGYIHSNPVKAGLCNLAENYKYSSARFYEIGVGEHGLLKHFKE